MALEIVGPIKKNSLAVLGEVSELRNLPAS